MLHAVMASQDNAARIVLNGNWSDRLELVRGSAAILNCRACLGLLNQVCSRLRNLN